MRKRAFTLIEVIVAFALLAMISTALFTTFRRQTLLKVELTKAETALLQRKYFQERLSQILSQSKSLFTEEGSLHLIFDNGIDPQTTFCHAVKSKIFLENDELLLEMTPFEGEEKRQEVLFQNVEAISYRFVSFPPKKDLTGNIIVPTSWTSKEVEMPRIVRISLMVDGEDIDFAFFLDHLAESGIKS